MTERDASLATTDRQPLLVQDVMSRPAQVIELDECMHDAWSAMLATGVHHLVVCDRGRCVGVLDDRTLFAHRPTGAFGVRSTPVRDLVSAVGCASVTPDTSVATVAQLMVTRGVDGVPVVSSHGKVVGIVTGRDVAEVVAAYGVTRPAADEKS